MKKVVERRRGLVMVGRMMEGREKEKEIVEAEEMSEVIHHLSILHYQSHCQFCIAGPNLAFQVRCQQRVCIDDECKDYTFC